MTSAEKNLDNMRQQVEQFQEQMQAIRLATGLEDEDEIIERYLNRDHQMAAANEQIKQMEDKLVTLRAKKAQLEIDLESVKFKGMGVSDFNREQVDTLTEKVDKARKKLKVSREEGAKVEQMALEIKQSVSSLCRRLENVKLTDEDSIGGSLQSIQHMHHLQSQLHSMTDNPLSGHKRERGLSFAGEQVVEQIGMMEVRSCDHD